jgi:hypothetical protein
MKRIKTWHGEMLVVALVLATMALIRGAWTEWLCAAAVLASFGHASVAERLREREAVRAKPEVDCVRWTWRYFILKEVAWAAFFIATGSYVALVGVAVFLAYPLWRSWWRKRHPLDLEERIPTAPFQKVRLGARRHDPREFKVINGGAEPPPVPDEWVMNWPLEDDDG